MFFMIDVDNIFKDVLIVFFVEGDFGIILLNLIGKN